MSRSLWKGPFVDQLLLKLVLRANKNFSQVMIKTKSRSTVIIPPFVGKIIGVYNGRKYIPVSVKEEMVGHKLGEFSPTRIFYGHTAGDKKLRKKVKS